MKNGDLIEHLGFGGRPFRERTVFMPPWCLKHGCRVIVTKERLEEEWPADETFRAFAAKLADAVQRALGEGKKIAEQELGGDCCPLGCLNPAAGNFPAPFLAPKVADIVKWRHFCGGFDGLSHTDMRIDATAPYYRLGQAYRRRFTVAS